MNFYRSSNKEIHESTLSIEEKKFLKDNFGLLRFFIAKNLQVRFLEFIKIHLEAIDKGFWLENWFGTNKHFSYVDNKFYYGIYDTVNCNSVISRKSFMKKLGRFIFYKLLKEKNEQKNKEFLDKSLKLTNDILNSKVENPFDK